MNLRENVRAVLQYEPFDHMPVIHFGYWQETLEKWREEGHLSLIHIEMCIRDSSHCAQNPGGLTACPGNIAGIIQTAIG